MFDILIKSFGFVMIIAMGCILKYKDVFKREDAHFLSLVVMNITLPCALLSSVLNIEINISLMIAMLIGFLANVITNLTGYLLFRNKKPMDKAIGMINMSGYNIGTFALPFIQSFFPASYLMSVCMFDTGNAIMCLGGNYSIADGIVHDNSKTSIKEFLKRLFSSIPLCTYLFLFVLSLLHLSLPQQILNVAMIAGNANPFLAMLMIGISLEIKMNNSEIKSIVKIILARYSISIVLSILIFYFCPFEIIIKKMLMLSLFAPVSGVAPVFSAKVGAKSPIPSAVNSISMIISITVMTLLVILFQ